MLVKEFLLKCIRIEYFYVIFFLGAMSINSLAQFDRSSGYFDPPERTDTTLIIGSYNIQFFGERKHDLGKLAKVIAQFDLCGIQEVKNPKAIKFLVDSLEALTKEDWGYNYGFPTYRPGGKYRETSAFVYRTKKVIIGDGTLGNVWDKEEIYRNDPFMCSFKSGNFDFTIFQIHTRWSNDDYGSREGEVVGICRHILDYKANNWQDDIIVMGDFNYSGKDSVLLSFAEELKYSQADNNPNTTYNRDNTGYSSPYDHFYFDFKITEEYLLNSCYAFNVTQFIYGNMMPESMALSKSELSDHLPIYAVFLTN